MPEAKRPLKITPILLVIGIVGILLLVYSLVTFTDTQPQHPTALPTATALPDEIVDDKGVSMRLVPAGEFNMGSEHGDQQEAPLHAVYLDAYYMDKYEVTNSLYRACVDAEACDLPKQLDLYNSPSYAEHPVVNVDWFMASNYCKWRGAYLPTEAQWEKAARGTDERIYPWGNEITCENVIFLDNRVPQQCNNRGGTIPVGTNPNNVSPYGVYDMAGNVWEWVADWWDTQYYAISPYANPTGPAAGDHKVLRGGSWNNIPVDLRTTTRNWDDQFFYHFLLGFRCAVDVTLPDTQLAAGP